MNIRSDEVDRLAERLAARKRINKTDAMKQAPENALRRLDQAPPARTAAALTGPGKGFYDALNGAR